MSFCCRWRVKTCISQKRKSSEHLHDGAADEADEGGAVLPQHVLHAGAVQAGNAVLQHHSRGCQEERHSCHRQATYMHVVIPKVLLSERDCWKQGRSTDLQQCAR